MEIKITDDATDWYERELEVKAGDSIRFFVRYGGVGGRIPGFSLGINLEQPNTVHASISINGITYYIEEADAWYFDENNLMVHLDEKLQEPQFTYEA